MTCAPSVDDEKVYVAMPLLFRVKVELAPSTVKAIVPVGIVVTVFVADATLNVTVSLAP